MYRHIVSLGQCCWLDHRSVSERCLLVIHRRCCRKQRLHGSADTDRPHAHSSYQCILTDYCVRLQSHNRLMLMLPMLLTTFTIWAMKKAQVLSCLGRCCEQTLDTNSAASPTTTRRSSTHRCSNMTRNTECQDPKIPGSQKLGHTRISVSQRQLDSQELLHNQDLKITRSQRQLDSEEFWHNQNQRKDRLQLDIVRAGSTRDNQRQT